jgi:hypothetical protein
VPGFAIAQPKPRCTGMAVVRKEWIAVMPTPREYRQRAEECLKLASEAKEIYARMELLELAGQFRAMAQRLDLGERRIARRTNARRNEVQQPSDARPTLPQGADLERYR